MIIKESSLSVKTVKMNIAVDIDGVIADADTQFRKQMNRIFERNFPRSRVKTFKYEASFDFNDKEFKLLYGLFLNKRIWQEVLPVRGAIESLKFLSKKSKIIIATARPLEVKDVTLEWLKRYKVPYNEIHFTLTEKHLLSENLKYRFHYFIEDHPDYALKIADSGINVLLFSYPWNKKIKEHALIKRVSNWKQILKVINQDNKI